MIEVLTPNTHEAVALLDERGCLTLSAMCYLDEFAPEQRELIDRHLQTCLSCAQQKAAISTTARWIRSGRPPVIIPLEARLAARRTALRSLKESPTRAPSTTNRTRAVTLINRRLRWQTSLITWTTILFISAASAGLLLAHFLL